jgi:outer membrane protein OmpA-like peptidoglycan-associated protein
MQEHAPAAEAPPIADRPESTGFWSKGWPVIALGIMTLLLVRACIPSGTPPAPPPFDVASATAANNTRALAALAAVTAETPLDVAIKALNLPTINFASGSAQIPADAKPVLDRAATVILLLPPTVRLEIAGHTDNTGTAGGNLVLARQRAQAIVEYFASAGVARERIAPQGYGDMRPVAPNSNEEGRFRNRRIEIKALGS